MAAPSDPLFTGSAPAMEPVSAAERMRVIDILRGYALFGVLLINMRNFDLPGQEWTGKVDRVALWLTIALGDSKFWTLFSFLFGLGFALQMGRAEERGARFLPVYLRRLFVLLLFGILHHVLLYEGDILFEYAVVGFLLLLFRARSSRTILLAASICLVIPMVQFAREVRSRKIQEAQQRVTQPTPQEAAQRQAEERVRREEGEKELRISTSGRYKEVVAYHARGFARQYSKLGSYLWRPGGPGGMLGGPFPLFLLGLYAGRRRFFQNLTAHLPFIRKLVWWGLAVGLVCTLVSVAGQRPELTEPYRRPLRHYTGILWYVGTPALSFAYASALILLVQKEKWMKRLIPLAAVGRMALTNYLLMSLIFTTMFLGYGLGLYGKIGPALNVAVTLLIYTFEAAFSVWWLERFRFGPVEWVWRTLTYGEFQPMRG